MIVFNSECVHLVIFDLKMIFIFNSSDLIETRKFKICSFRPISPWAQSHGSAAHEFKTDYKRADFEYCITNNLF